jgi:ribosomal protein S28E/S33
MEGIAKVLEIFEITGLKENVIQVVYQWLTSNV